MPIVPFAAAGGSKPKQRLEAPDDPWLLMAAAQMDAEGRLMEREDEATTPAEDPVNG